MLNALPHSTNSGGIKCADVSIFFIELSTKTYLTGVCYDLNDTVGELRVR